MIEAEAVLAVLWVLLVVEDIVVLYCDKNCETCIGLGNMFESPVINKRHFHLV